MDNPTPPIDSAYHYLVRPECETNYFVHGNDPNYSPSNVTVHESPTPEWIKPVSFPKPVDPATDNRRGNPNLLDDFQIDIASHTFYEHMVYKIWNAFDLENLGNLTINFDPSFQTLTIHECKVYRNRKWINKLEMNELRVIQQEFDLDSNIYSAQLSALLFLEDIREGDILDYSYSLSGSFSPKFSFQCPLQNRCRWEKNNIRIVKPPNRSFQSQTIPSDWDDYLTETEDEFIWEMEPCLPYEREPDQPPGYPFKAQFEMSEFSSWADVISNFISFYQFSDDFKNDAEVLELVRLWKENDATQEEQALLAIRYVQDEIRYTGIETGLGGFQPTDPLVTFKRRFGDCKGKSQLMKSFLELLGVHSDLCLVSTKLCAAVKNHLPSLHLFNHAILQINLENQTVYVDATAVYEGGDFAQMGCPFGAGLVISEKTQDLATIPMPIIYPEVECHTSFEMGSGDDVKMSIVVHFAGSEANYYRSILKSKGLPRLTESLENFIGTQFDLSEPLSPPRIEDDRAKNHLTVSVEFQLGYPWTNTGKKSDKYLSYIPYFLAGYLGQNIDTDRVTPLQLIPSRIKESVSVAGGYLLTNSETIEHEAFTFQSITSDSNKVEFELFTHLDELSSEELGSYLEKLNEALDEIGVLIKRR